MNPDPRDYLRDHLLLSSLVLEHIHSDLILQDQILEVTRLLIKTFQAGNKLLICGNGGSCADAQHIAAEFVGNYQRNRRALPALALDPPAALTSISNDLDFKLAFQRQIEAHAKSDDVVIGLSTSGESPNVIGAMATAAHVGAVPVFITGKTGGCIFARVNIIIPSTSTPIIQQATMTIAHAICGIVEQEMFPQ